MFHLFNRVYLDTDFRVTDTHQSIIASKRWYQHPITRSYHNLHSHALDLDDLIEHTHGGCVEAFWLSLLQNPEKLVIYLDPDALLRLQIQYWKSVFANPTLDLCYRLYRQHKEVLILNGMMDNLGGWDTATRSREVNEEIAYRNSILNKVEFMRLYDTVEPSQTLMSLDHNVLSMELLMGHYFATGRQDASTQAELVRRLRLIAWDLFLDEVMELRRDVLWAGYEIKQLDTSIAHRGGDIVSILGASKLFSWVLDPKIGTDMAHTQANLSFEHFKKCYFLMGKALDDHQRGQGVGNSLEYDYKQKFYSDFLAHDDMLGMLDRDIERGFRTSFCTDVFSYKTNRHLVAELYQLERAQSPKREQYRLR